MFLSHIYGIVSIYMLPKELVSIIFILRADLADI